MVYTWHAVTEDEKEEIRKNAKNLLDEFSAKIAKVSVREKKEEGEENLREEGEGWETNEKFRELMMDNAPMVEDGLIMTDKGGWKK